MRSLIRILLFTLLAASIIYIVALLAGNNPQRGPLVIALLAVVAATVAALPTLRLLEIQEDATRPYVVPHLDYTSRYMLLQLRVANLGRAVAHDIQLTWDGPRLIDHKSEEVTALDEIAILLPDKSASQLIGLSTDKVKELRANTISGHCSYKDANGKHFRERFHLSAKGHGKELTYDTELVEALHEVQKIPEALSEIARVFGE